MATKSLTGMGAKSPLEVRSRRSRINALWPKLVPVLPWLMLPLLVPLLLGLGLGSESVPVVP